MARRHPVGIDPLECRRCLTIVAEVSSGDLFISGDADGDVEILAVGAQTFQVTDNGQTIATLGGVKDDVRIDIDADQAAANPVALDLADQSVDTVLADLVSS